MIHFDWNSVWTGLVGLGLGLAALNKRLRSIVQKVEPVFEKVEHVYEHVKNNKETKVVVKEIQTALTSETSVERDAAIKAAALTALNVLKTDAISATDIQRAAIAKYVSDVIPSKFKTDVTQSRIDDTLKLISEELKSAEQHDGLKSAQAFMIWLNDVKTPTTIVPEAPATTTIATTAPVQA